MKKLIYTLTLLFSFLTINAQVNLEEGLIAYYPFNGNADDESGNEYHGTTYNLTLVDDKDSNENKAYYFSSDNSVIKIPDVADLRLAATDYSISTWVNVEAFSNPISSTILSKRTLGSNNGYLFDIVGNNHPQGYVEGDIKFIVSQNIDLVVNANYFLQKEQWVHLLLVYCFDTQRLSIFVDGELKNENLLNSPNGNAIGELWIGRDPINDSSDLAFQGSMDELRIYNRKLNNNEIQALNNQIFTSTELTELSKIKVFPNPVNNTLFIQTKNEQIEEMSLINISGKKVYQGAFRNEISVSGFTSGIYFLQLKNKEGKLIKTKKVVIVNEIRA